MFWMSYPPHMFPPKFSYVICPTLRKIKTLFCCKIHMECQHHMYQYQMYLSVKYSQFFSSFAIRWSILIMPISKQFKWFNYLQIFDSNIYNIFSTTYSSLCFYVFSQLWSLFHVSSITRNVCAWFYWMWYQFRWSIDETISQLKSFNENNLLLVGFAICNWILFSIIIYTYYSESTLVIFMWFQS